MFCGWLTPNFRGSDLVVRKCPRPENLNGIPACVLIGDYDQIPLQSFAARSKHPGGVQAAHCDGSVHFLSETTNKNNIIQWMSYRNDSKTFASPF